MNILLPVGIAAGAFLIALRLYPRWIARVFREDDRNLPPSVRFADGRDFVETRSHVVFGQHFAAIAGAGPIVGPTLALAYGWTPVWLWIVCGGIFFGAVHDMTALFTSVRESGRTVAEIARRTLGSAGYLLMLVVLIFVLTVINAIFLNLSVTALTSVYPLAALGLDPDQTLLNVSVADDVARAHIGGIATTSVFVITAFAPVLGWLIRRRNLPTRWAYALAFGVAVGSVLLGFRHPVTLDGDTWRLVMSGYVFVACAVPVWLILQPRDFTNVQILYGGVLLVGFSALVAGIFGGARLQAPALDLEAGHAAMRGGLWPILFITVACGAISGFHSLVASGTTVRQLGRESDCRRIGYGAMILESLLAVLVLVAVASMLPQAEYLSVVYPAVGPANPILGFALGTGRLVHEAVPLIPVAVAVVFGILMVEGFVVTTLDTAVRLCRYLLEEFWTFVFGDRTPALLHRPVVNTAIAVALMLFFALNATVRQMWPIFGAGNQLIGALTLITVTVWLVQRACARLFVLLPAAFMVVTTFAALIVLVRANFGPGGNTILGITAGSLFVLAVGVLVVGVSRFAQALQAPIDTRMGETPVHPMP
jgi:carbon starvation protein